MRRWTHSYTVLGISLSLQKNSLVGRLVSTPCTYRHCSLQDAPIKEGNIKYMEIWHHWQTRPADILWKKKKSHRVALIHSKKQFFNNHLRLFQDTEKYLPSLLLNKWINDSGQAFPSHGTGDGIHINSARETIWEGKPRFLLCNWRTATPLHLRSHPKRRGVGELHRLPS